MYVFVLLNLIALRNKQLPRATTSRSRIETKVNDSNHRTRIEALFVLIRYQLGERATLAVTRALPHAHTDDLPLPIPLTRSRYPHTLTYFRSRLSRCWLHAQVFSTGCLGNVFVLLQGRL